LIIVVLRENEGWGVGGVDGESRRGAGGDTGNLHRDKGETLGGPVRKGGSLGENDAQRGVGVKLEV